jgi:hypothetical protein
LCRSVPAQSATGNPPAGSRSDSGSAPRKKSSVSDGADHSKLENTAGDRCQCVGEIDSDAVAKIHTALGTTIPPNGFDFKDVPLADIISSLQRQLQIPIQLDQKALAEAAIDTRTPLTISLHGISFRSALRIMLKSIELTYMISDEVVLITTKETAEKELITCVYDVHDLPWKTMEHTSPGSGADYNPLIGAITDCIVTDTWHENGGGSANIGFVEPGMLAISQSREVHEELRSFFAIIRRMQANIDPNAESAGTRQKPAPTPKEVVSESPHASSAKSK